MMPSKPTLVNSAVLPIRLATSLPISMSAPMGSEPCRNSIGGKAMSEQNTSFSSWALAASATIAVAAQLVAMTPTTSSTRMHSQLLDPNLEFTMPTPHYRRYRRESTCPHQARSPVRAISNPTLEWRLRVDRFTEGGQRPAAQTSFSIIGRFHGGADHLFRMQQVFLERRYRLWPPLPEQVQELAVPPKEVVQVIVRPVGDREHQTKLHQRPDDGRPQPANAERRDDSRVERDVGLDHPPSVSPRCGLGHVEQGSLQLLQAPRRGGNQ